ncbi:hypothetical protein Tco_1386673 [Tanacetum coccineum]
MMVQAQQEQGEGSEMPTDPYYTPTIIQPSTSQPLLKQRLRRPKRKDTQVPQPSGPIDNVADEVVYEEIDDNLVRASATASSLEAEQDSGNIDKTRSKATPNEPSSLGTSSGGVNTPRSDEDRLKLNELMEFCTKLQQRVLDLENTRCSHAQESYSLETKREKIDDIDKDAEITLVHETQGRYGDEEMFDTSVLDGDEMLAEPEVTDKDVNLSVDEVTLAQALAALKNCKSSGKNQCCREPSESITTTPTLITTTAATIITVVSTRPKAKGLVIHEEEQATTLTVSLQQPSQLNVQDKRKEIMVEEPVKMNKKDQIGLDEEIAFKLQAKEEEGRKVESEKKTQREEGSQHCYEGQEKLSIEEKSKLFVQLLEARKKHFATMRAQEMGKKPPTKAQNRNTFFKKQKLEEDKETTELQRLIEVVPDKEEVAIDAIPLETKPPRIVDYKIPKEGKKTCYQIIMADGSSKMYLVFSHMLKSFNREDLETLWKLVKAKHGSTRPEEGYERVLLGDLKTMFDPHAEEQVWRNQ